MAQLDLDRARRLSAELASAYSQAEATLVAQMSRRLAAGIDGPEWARLKLQATAELRQWTQQFMAQLDQIGAEAAARAVAGGYAMGGDAGLAALGRVVGGNSLARLQAARRVLPGLAAQQQLVRSLTYRLRSTHLPVIRWVTDSYQKVIAAGAAPQVLLGVVTRRQATEQAFQRLIGQGVQGFTDAAGRRWGLASYAEMATRTTVAQAAVQGQLERLQAANVDLVIISDAVQECQRCRPWEGKILSRSGQPGARQEHHADVTQERQVAVHVAGSLSEAIAAGLFHANCRHSLSAYFPGLTKAPTHQTADPAGDKARQDLRAMERRQRELKLRREGAMTDAERARLDGMIKNQSAKIKAHVEAHADLGLVRHPERERLDLGYRRPPGSALNPDLPRPTAPTGTFPAFDPATASTTQVAPISDAVLFSPPLSVAQQDVVDTIINRGIQQGEMYSRDVSQLLNAELGNQARISDAIFRQFNRVDIGLTDPDMGYWIDHGNTYAYYESATRRIAFNPNWLTDMPAIDEAKLANQITGWTVRGQADGGIQMTFSHEYGHHVGRMLERVYSGGISGYDAETARALFLPLCEELGIPARFAPWEARDKEFARLGYMRVSDADSWVRHYAPEIAAKVSVYGSKSIHEMLAEIWSSYTRGGRHVTPLAARIGPIMKRLAERAAERMAA